MQLLLVACDGDVDNTATESPRLLAAQTYGCGASAIHDNGYLVYLTVAQTCAENGPIYVDVTWGTSRASATRLLTLDRYSEPIEVEFEPGRKRSISLHRRGTWRSFPNQGTWEWRDGAGLLVKDGGLYLLGGWNSDRGGLNDVWFTRDLEHWQLLLARAPWVGRHGSGWVVHHDRLYVIGGDLIDDVWSSADGVQWRQERAAAAFGKRYTPVAISDGTRLLLYGGQYWEPYDWCVFKPECSAVGLNDVWSSPDGSTWQLVDRAPWSGRALVHGGAYFKGRIYVIGGGLKLGLPGASLTETIAEFADVWSSPDGVQWRLESNQFEFAPRTHFALTATPHGCYVANGSVGTQPNVSREIFFAPDCVHFSAVPVPADMGPRHASSLAYYNGSIVILGGHRDTAGTIVWQYFPEAAGQ
jgi:hypothetical protein